MKNISISIKKVSFRKIDKEDYPFLRTMLYKALFVPEGEKPFDKTVIDIPEISKYIDNWGADGDFGLIVLKKEELVGAIWGRLFHEENKGYGFVDNDTPELTMAIKKDYRNQGLGTKLMKAFFTAAKDKGFNALSLSVDKRNQALNFYKRLGFKIVNESETAYTLKREL